MEFSKSVKGILEEYLDKPNTPAVRAEITTRVYNHMRNLHEELFPRKSINIDDLTFRLEYKKGDNHIHLAPYGPGAAFLLTHDN